MNIYKLLPFARWRSFPCFTYKVVPNKIRAWLCYQGSMTQKIRSISPDIKIDVVQHKWDIPCFQEREALRLLQQPALVREIRMLCNNEVWIIARTVIPSSALLGKWLALKRLGNKPLGDFLFKDPNVARSQFEFQLLGPHQSKNKMDDFAFTEELWARRSLFYLNGKSILLTEVFMPCMWRTIL